ncbi:MAG: hypothetical protein SOY49_05555 [Prevotella sp.]|nr:hypothetical protein [Prevotella sp.]
MEMQKYIIVGLLALSCVTVGAQKKRPKAKVVAKPETETPAQRLYQSMLSSTAKVMVIDSMVVGKDDFLSYIPLNRESGSLMRCQDFFKDNRYPQGAVYVNEFRNSCYFAEGDTTRNSRLYTSHLLGEQWSKPEILKGITDEYTAPNYPFLMADGVTLFFGAKGPKSLGGYDIFMTVYDRSSDQYYTPENYGLPFNSKFNDYMLAIDDLDTLGWFVSDRYQPEGKVCIYIFVPTNPRQNFDGENISEEKLKHYANLNEIKDTWVWGNREKAIAKLKKMQSRRRLTDQTDDFSFVINDALTYHHVNDFRSPSARKRYLKLKLKQHDLSDNRKELELLRSQYETAKTGDRALLREKILQLEQEVDKERLSLKQIEKEIRHTEITFITK